MMEHFYLRFRPLLEPPWVMQILSIRLAKFLMTFKSNACIVTFLSYMSVTSLSTVTEETSLVAQKYLIYH